MESEQSRKRRRYSPEVKAQILLFFRFGDLQEVLLVASAFKRVEDGALHVEIVVGIVFNALVFDRIGRPR